MEITHRVSGGTEKGWLKKLKQLGISAEVDELGSVFAISESDSRWPELEKELKRQPKDSAVDDLISTKFTPQDLNRAEYLQLQPARQAGYPQPEDELRFLEETYNIRCLPYGNGKIKFSNPDGCAECDLGKQQRAPFRWTAEPDWGRWQIMLVNWVLDEFFVRPEAWKNIFKPFGISCRPVLRHRTGEPLRTVVQLEIVTVASSPLRLEHVGFEACPACQGRKYSVNEVSRGLFPPFRKPPRPAAIMKSQEHFGSEGQADKAVFISAELYRRIVEKKLYRVLATPVAWPGCRFVDGAWRPEPSGHDKGGKVKGGSN